MCIDPTLARFRHPHWLAAALLAVATAGVQAQSSSTPPSNDAQRIAFADFYRQPIGARGLETSDTLRRAEGRLVTLTGYIVAQEEPSAGRFLLTPRPVRMSEHADGDADDLPPSTVTVLLDASQRERIVAHSTGPVTLTGRLELGRAEAADGRVSWVRLHLPPQALAEAATTAATPQTR
jgi:hypothetical protein